MMPVRQHTDSRTATIVNGQHMYDEQYERLTADCKPGKPNAIFISINDPVFVIPNDQH